MPKSLFRESNKIVRALLLAAGKGTRLQPLTNYWPKCLMPIAGRPLLEYWLKILHDLGIKDVLVNTHSHKDHVETFLARKQFSNWVKPVFEKKLLIEMISGFYCVVNLIDQIVHIYYKDNSQLSKLEVIINELVLKMELTPSEFDSHSIFIEQKNDF